MKTTIWSNMNSQTRKIVTAGAVAILAVVLVVIPHVSSMYILRNIIMIGFYLTLALSLNIATGYLGHVSLGHAAFYAIGAYTSVILTTQVGGVNYFVATLAGGLVAAAFGVILSLGVMKLSGTYIAIITLGFFQVIMSVILNWKDLTRGAAGIYYIPAPSIFGFTFTLENGGIYYLILGTSLLTMLVCHLVDKSKLGRALRAIKDDELVAQLMGINANRYKTMAYALAAFFAGLAGSLYGHFMGYINNGTFTYNMCITTLCIVILGGMGSIKGMVVGAIIISPLGEVLRFLIDQVSGLTGGLNLSFKPEEWRIAIYGLVMVLIMRFRPQGLLGGFSKQPYKLPKGIVRGGVADGDARSE